MLGRVALVVVLALVACKKEKDATEKLGGSEPAPTTSGGSRPSDPPKTNTESWDKYTGPGFTIEAPGAATVSHVDANDGDPAYDAHVYRKTGKETWEVQIYEIPADANLTRKVDTLRDRIIFTVGQKHSEDWIEEGDLRGRDLHYDMDTADAPSARSKILAKGTRMYHVRATYKSRDKAREAAADRFVDSFTLD